jgi:hypothetical protein
VEEFKNEIKLSLAKISVQEPDLLYEIIADLSNNSTYEEKKEKYKFTDFDKIIFRLTNKWIEDGKKMRILWTFLLLYKCHSVVEVASFLVKKDGTSLKISTINRYRTQAIKDIIGFANNAKIKLEIEEVLKRQYYGSRNR